MLALLLPRTAAAQNNTCPVCSDTDCSVRGCSNFGTCAKTCSCQTGFGGALCADPVCGSTATANALREKQTAGQCVCQAATGPNCNVCLLDSVCQASSSASPILGSAMVCNAAPQVWSTAHHSVCQIQNTLVSAIFPGNIRVTIERNVKNSSTFASLWLQETAQFSCLLTDCSQQIATTDTTWQCKALACSCNAGTDFCGGKSLDLTAVINAATGKALLTCPTTNSTSCNLKFDFLAGLIPSGLALNDCAFGECAYPSSRPGFTFAKSVELLFLTIGQCTGPGWNIWSCSRLNSDFTVGCVCPIYLARFEAQAFC